MIPPLCCDLCQWPMATDHLAPPVEGQILGLLVCTECIEDTLQSEIVG